MVKQTKTYYLDTNVLIHDPESPLAFEEHDVVIVAPVYEELERKKSDKGPVAYACQEVFTLLEHLLQTQPVSIEEREGGHIWTIITLPEHGRLLLHYHPQERLAYADEYLLHEIKQSKGILVSKDKSLRVNLMRIGLQDHVEDYKKDRVLNLYKGYQEILVSQDLINIFYKQKSLPLECLGDFAPKELYPHQFIQFTNECNEKHTALATLQNGVFLPLHEIPPMKIKPRSREQQMAMSMFADNSIPLVTITGDPGTGKTLLAMSIGKWAVQAGIYKHMILLRPIVGEGLGALPGEKNEKLRPWMAPFVDNLRPIYLEPGQFASPDDLLERFMSEISVEMEALCYVRGRTWEDTLIIVDEAQNLTPHQAKALTSRVGTGSKMILAGDPTNNQIDNKYLTPTTNGLVYVVDRMKMSQQTAHLHIQNIERSPLVKDVVKML
ncbi:PhoH family protein [Cytobacillus sp. FJAT-54145]|uniref:PhoH family protein n=1 Tax=Cytobacillus spartinae TaxID=3299023 RepID=A0ABW6K9T6_9BACI